MKRQRPQSGRIRRLRALMDARHIDALLVCRQENVRYLTGFTGSSGCVLIAEGRPVLITDFRYETQAARESAGTRLLIQRKDIFSAIAEAAADLGVKRLWFDESSMTMDRVRALKKKGFSLKAIKDPISELRMRKDAGEAGKIKKSIRRAEASFRELLTSIVPGKTERELGLRLEWLMREKGARKAAFDTIVASGPNGAMPHASVSNRKIRSGDMVTFDFGAEADGYFCDITRTVCVGRPSGKQMQIHDLVLRAQQAAINSIQEGGLCSKIDRAARELIEQAGQGKQFGHSTGHGVGLMVHEGPSVSALSKERVERGMVFTVEPGVYIPGWGGVRIEDMVYLSDSGPEVITTLSRELLIRRIEY